MIAIAIGDVLVGVGRLEWEEGLANWRNIPSSSCSTLSSFGDCSSLDVSVAKVVMVAENRPAWNLWIIRVKPNRSDDTHKHKQRVHTLTTISNEVLIHVLKDLAVVTIRA